MGNYNLIWGINRYPSKKKAQKIHYKKKVLNYEERLDEAIELNKELQDKLTSKESEIQRNSRDNQAKFSEMDKFTKNLKEDFLEKIVGLNETIKDLKIGLSQADVKESKKIMFIIRQMVIF